MRGILFFIAGILIPFASQASVEVDQVEASISTTRDSLNRPFLSFGGSLLFEDSNDRRYQVSVAPPLISIGIKRLWLSDQTDDVRSFWAARLEYTNAEARDGNESISVLRKRQSLLLWFNRDFGDAQGWVPYGALAAGFSRREVETRLQDSIESVSGGWLGTAAAAAGFRANWSPSVTARFEFRYELGDAQALSEKANDARLGVAAMIETMF